MEADMNAETMRQNSEGCLVLAENAANEPARRRFLRMAEAWKTLADNKDWLDGCVSGDHAPIQPELHSAA
jgi:hypothetical protein